MVLIMKVVWLLVHEYSGGRQYQIYKTRVSAEKALKDILKDYKKEGVKINTNTTNFEEIYEKCKSVMFIRPQEIL